MKQNNKVPVMLLFFNRPANLEKVFNAVSRYQPDELFLVQDGARKDREDDVVNIEKCRAIVENITWECNVHKNYAVENMSCDHREYTGISWCFSFVDRLIILEDDCVPEEGFFTLCEECLEKYKDETNIHSIAGFNRVGKYDTPYDYIFSMTSAGWGWATWKRVWDKVEKNRELGFLENNVDADYLDKRIDKRIKDIYGNFIPYMKRTKADNKKSNKITSWEKLVGFTLLADNMLSITPAKNMIKYIGISENATHTSSDYRLLPHKVSKVLLQPSYSIEGEIKHPPFMVRDIRFEKLSNNTLRMLPYMDRLEVGFRRLLYGRKKKTTIHS